MLGGDDGEGDTKARVRSRREDAKGRVVASDDRKVELDARRPADPVALHGLHALGPLDARKGVQQLVGVGGDPKEPLLEPRRSTRSPERSQVPSASTCSFASTVAQPGHQFTTADAR